MKITLTNGATVQTLCDGVSYAGQTDRMIGPVSLLGLDINWVERQAKRPLRAVWAQPLPGYNRTGRFGFSVYRIFADEASAQQWAFFTFPSTFLSSGTLSLYVSAKQHADIANAVLAPPLRIVPTGINVDVSFVFDGGAISFVTDP